VQARAVPARRRLRRPALALQACLFALAILLGGRPALAVDAKTEAAAKDAIKKTASDYASGDYATAAARLDKALRACGEKKCSPGTKAFVLRDLGTMQFKMGDKDAAQQSFQQALAIDRDIDLASKYDAPDVRAIWNKAKAAAAEKNPGPPPEQPIGGDFTHTAPTEQKVNTPLPIYVEPPEGTSLTKVVVKYKGARMSDWSKVELTRMGDGWGGTIPCGAAKQGSLQYWVQGFDESGSPAASSGDPQHPFTVPIHTEISGDEPSLPGKDPPKTCSASEAASGGEGGDEGQEGGGQAWSGHRNWARLWVGAAFTFEFVGMPAVEDACKLSTNPPGQQPPPGFPANSSNLYCVDSTGADFPTRSLPAGPAENAAIIPGQGGHSGGGPQLGNARVMLSVDYALSQNLLVGGRFGYVFNSYPGSAASTDGRAAGFRVHLEGRATYILGDKPLERVGFAALGFAGLGLSEFDGHVTSVVTLTNPMGASKAPLVQPVDIWVTDGPFFLLVGAGARYQFSPRLAATAALRLNIAIGGNGVLPTYGPELGIQYGF
jgi:Tfp pilus assembly protein PilF